MWSSVNENIVWCFLGSGTREQLFKGQRGIGQRWKNEARLGTLENCKWPVCLAYKEVKNFYKVFGHFGLQKNKKGRG